MEYGKAQLTSVIPWHCTPSHMC